MIYIGNYKNLITSKLMNHLETYNGDTIPVWQPDRWSGRPEWEESKERARPGYAHKTHDFQQFNSRSKDMEDFNFELPQILNDNRATLWWFVKLLPGQMQAMHFDPHLIEIQNPQRYTVFMQDYQPGHIFVWGDKMISNYKAGDLFKWSDPMCYHGCVNISYETRYTLQLTTYDD
jgi:hypothetical protein